MNMEEDVATWISKDNRNQMFLVDETDLNMG